MSAALTTEANLSFAGKTQRIVGSQLNAVTSYGTVGEALVNEGDEKACQAVYGNDILVRFVAKCQKIGTTRV